MNLFQNAKFFTTVNHLKDLPEEREWLIDVYLRGVRAE